MAKDRRISIEDADIRHGRKSRLLHQKITFLSVHIT